MHPNMMANGRKYILSAKGALLVGVAFCWSGAASAQTAPPQSSTQVTEIVVTAQKRTENLQNVPASVTALNTHNLSLGGLVRIEDYVALVPGLSITSSSEGFTQLTIRGITTGLSQSAPSTSIYVDEAPVGSVNAYGHGSQITPDIDPADLAQIEVLKGPQGTLYGADSVGGLVKFVTVSPDYHTFGGQVAVGGTSVDHGGDGYTVRGSVNVPLIQGDLVARVSGFDREDPGFIDNVTGQKNSNDTGVNGGRLELAWKPTDHFSLDLSALTQDVRDADAAVEDVQYGSLTPIYGDLKSQHYIDAVSSIVERVYNATAKGDVNGFNLVSSTTYETIGTDAQADATNSFGPTLSAVFHIPHIGVEAPLITQTDRFTQEFRVSSKAFDNKLDYQAGLFFTHETDLLDIPAYSEFSTVTRAPIALPNIISAEIQSKYDEYSAFANATYHFTSAFDVLAGVRYSQDNQDYLQNYSGLLVPGGKFIKPGTSSDSVPTFLVSPEYKLSDDQMIYARVSDGYRPGGPNAAPPGISPNAKPSFQPDTLTSYEVGYKSELLNRTVSVDAALFYTDWQKIQIETSAGGFKFYVNGGAAVSQGGELTVLYKPLAGLTLGLNGSYTDAHLTSAAPAAGGLSGDELPFVPKWAGSLTSDYRWSLPDNLMADVGASVNYTGDRRDDYSANVPLTVPSFTTVNLNAGIQRDRWTLSVFAKNVTDSRGIIYLATEGLSPNKTSPMAAGVIQPRTIGALLSVKF